jgi:class 3 adenylate cyclase
VPAQTRGFLFSDLRGYSAYTERHGDRAARDLLTRYRRVVREVIVSFRGAEVRTEGDSFYVVFDSVSEAVQAALGIQSALLSDTDGEPIRAGIGIHAGEVEDDAEQGIVSSAVNIAARICAAADPGEVLVSDTVRALTRSYLDVSFAAGGRRKLKGITDPVTLYRVEASGASSQTKPGFESMRRLSLPLVLGIVGAFLIVSLVVATMIREGVGFVADVPASSGRVPESLAPPAASSSPLPSVTGAPSGSVATNGVTTIDLGKDATFGRVQPVELDAGSYTFADFRPAVTFTVDGVGWYAAMDDVDAALLLLDDSSETRGLTEAGNVAFGSVQVVFNDPCDLTDSTILDTTPNALIEWLQTHELLTTSGVRPVNIGGHSGIEVEASLSGSGCHGAKLVDLFPVAENRYYLAAGHRLRVIALSPAGRSLVILVQMTPEANQEIGARVDQLVDGIEIDPS